MLSDHCLTFLNQINDIINLGHLKIFSEDQKTKIFFFKNSFAFATANTKNAISYMYELYIPGAHSRLNSLTTLEDKLPQLPTSHKRGIHKHTHTDRNTHTHTHTHTHMTIAIGEMKCVRSRLK